MNVVSWVFFFFFKQKTAYEITVWLEFRRVLFDLVRKLALLLQIYQILLVFRQSIPSVFQVLFGIGIRSEERREGKSVDLGGRRIIKKKNTMIYINSSNLQHMI